MLIHFIQEISRTDLILFSLFLRVWHFANTVLNEPLVEISLLRDGVRGEVFDILSRLLIFDQFLNSLDGVVL